MSEGSIPKAPLVLGLAGLVPFFGLTLAMAIGAPALPPSIVLGAALAAYGAVIVSFLGGIRWGLATAVARQDAAARHYAIAVIPSLIAWAALLLPLTGALAVLGVVALALGPIDRNLIASGLAPAWFGKLRLILSTGAGTSLLVAAALAGVSHQPG